MVVVLDSLQCQAGERVGDATLVPKLVPEGQALLEQGLRPCVVALAVDHPAQILDQAGVVGTVSPLTPQRQGTCYTSRVRRRTMRLAGVLCALALLLARAAVLSAGRMAPEGTLEVLIALLLAVAVLAILRRILTIQTVDGEAIFGALDVYIMFGLSFAAVYAAIGTFSATPFFGTQATVTSGSYQFFSFVTLTTVGYGNLVPATQVGQSLAVLEALLGQIYLVTLVARLVSGFQPGPHRRALRQPVAKREARGAMGNGDAESETSTSPKAAEPSPTRK